MTLDELQIGHSARIVSVGGDGPLRQHLLDLGLTPGAFARMSKHAPMGDPLQIQIHHYELTLRKDDAAKITVAETAEPPQPTSSPEASEPAHPGLGEGIPYHDPKHERPLPGGETLTFALAGNQNCGKTTLFNQITGANQHVGNFPGVTVDRKSGAIRGHANTLVTDLPGIYSLSPYTSEEIVSREFILDERPRGIINIVDATNIERNLYLTVQLLELGVPTVLALNFIDEMRGNGGTVLVNEMEKRLGVPVVPISARGNEGVDELLRHAVHIAKYQEPPVAQDFCQPEDHGGAVHRCIHAVRHLIEDNARRAGIPVRFAATKVVEGDESIIRGLKLSHGARETIEGVVRQMEQERGMDRAAAVADMRYDFINRLCEATVVHPAKSREHLRSLRIDRVLTGRLTALPVFAVIMGLIFYLTFDLVGGTLQEWLEEGIDAFTAAAADALTAWNVNSTVRSLVVDGVFAGVGSVLSFIPIIVTLFFFLSMLEDSGYMARIAFVTDRLLRRIGLSGRSIVPLLIGFGCTVPGVMATRTLPSERDRRLTIMLTPFMSCTAKLPIFAFFCAAFFPDRAAAVMCGMYLLGVAAGVLTALALKKTAFRGEAVPFVMELPNYRLPAMGTTLRLLGDKARDFLERAFTVIFMATVVIWFLQTFSFRLDIVDDAADSMLGQVAAFAAPAFAPLGFADWRVATSLVGGFMAKESVVSTLTVLFGSAADFRQALTASAALALMVFSLLYTPCVAAIAAIRRELGGRAAVTVAAAQCLIAYAAAAVTHMLTSAL